MRVDGICMTTAVLHRKLFVEPFVGLGERAKEETEHEGRRNLHDDGSVTQEAICKMFF